MVTLLVLLWDLSCARAAPELGILPTGAQSGEEGGHWEAWNSKAVALVWGCTMGPLRESMPKACQLLTKSPSEPT